jgi:hypothetical protein
MNKNTNIINYITYIDKYIDDLNLDEKLNIYKMIMDNSIDENLIIEKGVGIEIKFKHLSNDLIISIYNFIQSKIIKKQNETANFSYE